MKILSLRNITLSLLSLSIFGCNDVAVTQTAPPPPAVVVETLAKANITPQRDFIGRTEATEDVSIRAQVGGTLLKRHFTAGDDVQKGDLLFEIDPSSFITDVEQKNAALKHAESAYKIAKNRWQRGTKLSKTGAISELDIDELTASMNQTESDVALNKASLETAQLNLSYTKIVAPISGRISRSQVSIGDLVTANNLELATLVQLDPIWVNFQVSEKVLTETRRDVNDGAPINIEDVKVTIALSDKHTYEHSGFIDFVDNRVDQNTGTLAIRAKFDNPEKSLLPGQYTSLSLYLPNTKEVLLISQSAVQEEQQGRFVLVVNNENKIEKRMVTLGERYDIRWQVLKGLAPGEKIVVEGLQKVRVGIEVAPTEQTDTPFSSNNEK